MKGSVFSLSVLFLLLSVDVVKSKKKKECPPIIVVDRRHYRNIGKGETTCRGDISKCIYSSLWEEYCMNGYFGHYQPQLLPPLLHDARKKSGNGGNFVTTNVGVANPNNTPFNMSTITDPVTQYTLYSAEFAVNKL